MALEVFTSGKLGAKLVILGGGCQLIRKITLWLVLERPTSPLLTGNCRYYTSGAKQNCPHF